MPRVEVAIELDTITCYLATCAITFAVPQLWRDQKIRDHTGFYCPNGHNQAFTAKSREEQLRGELARVKKTVDYFREETHRLNDKAATLKRRVAAQKANVTKLKRKAIAGECAFCHHQFPDVAAHVEAEHQTEIAEVGAEEGDDAE